MLYQSRWWIFRYFLFFLGKQRFPQNVYKEKVLASTRIALLFSYSGAFSDVHKGREIATGHEYAIKCIKRRELEGRQETLENEISIQMK